MNWSDGVLVGGLADKPQGELIGELAGRLGDHLVSQLVSQLNCQLCFNIDSAR